jgi:acetyltransferase-like isoleucine patch superfamily enzyme
MGTDGTSIIVGEDCMFSAFISASTDDAHAIIDLTNGKQLNPAADIIVEPHVWVGIGAQIRKGVTIGFGSIVGAGAIVTRDVPRKCAVVGSPAKQTRSNVSWVRQRFARDDSVRIIIDLQRRYGCVDHVPSGGQND